MNLCQKVWNHHASRIEDQKSSHLKWRNTQHFVGIWLGTKQTAPHSFRITEMPLTPDSSAGWLAKCPIKCGSKKTMPFREIVAGEACHSKHGMFFCENSCWCPRHKRNVDDKCFYINLGQELFSCFSKSSVVTVCRPVLVYWGGHVHLQT